MKRSCISLCCGFLVGCTGLNPEFGGTDGDTDRASASQTDTASGPSSPSGSDTTASASGSSGPTSDSDPSTGGADTSAGTTDPSDTTGPTSDCPGDKVCVELPDGWQGPIYGPDAVVDPSMCPDGFASEVIWGRGALPTCECTEGSFGACLFDVTSFGDNTCTEGLEARFSLDDVMAGCHAVEGEEDVAGITVDAVAEATCPQPHPQFPQRFPRCEMAVPACGTQGICNDGEPICVWRTDDQECPADWARTVYYEKLSCNCTPGLETANCVSSTSLHFDEACETNALNTWNGGSCTGTGDEDTLFINLSDQTLPPDELVSCASTNENGRAAPGNPITVCCR